MQVYKITAIVVPSSWIDVDASSWIDEGEDDDEDGEEEKVE